MKWNRQDYIDLITFGGCERQMFVELFGPLIGLDEEWRLQGASEDEIGMIAFDWDYVPTLSSGGRVGIMGGFQPRVLEDTEDYTISIDNLGRTMKLPKKFATIALPLDFPVKDMDSWMKIKHFYTFSEDRIDYDRIELCLAKQKEGTLITASILGGFDTVRELMGEEGACIAYYEDPELIQDIMATITDTAIKVYERITDKLTIDNLCVHEDMAGKSGPLVGPNIVKEFIAPYYSKLWDLMSSRGTKIFSQDSDGNMCAVLDAFMECGVNVTYPCEPAAGMDVVELRKKYGKRLAFKGGVDKHVLRKSKNDILRELEYKMQPMMREGGIVFGLDHRIPNGTPIENYRFYVNTSREILGLSPLSKDKIGWSRMAF